MHYFSPFDTLAIIIISSAVELHEYKVSWDTTVGLITDSIFLIILITQSLALS